MSAVAKRIGVAVAMFLMNVAVQAGEKYKPFVLGYRATGDVAAVAAEVKKKVAGAGFEVIGTYAPYATTQIIVVTDAALKENAAKSKFGGYGAAQRVAITKIGNEVQVSYTNPTYMAYAYRMGGDLKSVTDRLGTALGRIQEFGPEKALDASALRKYHYMLGMEYFDDPSVLAEYKSHEEALKAVEEKLAQSVAGITKVYRVDVPGKQETIFGVAMRGQNNKYQDDTFIMSEIDFKPIRSSAHLPYEMLVSGNKVYALYARFRIAINFPDLSMMGKHSFMNIMNSPAAIQEALTRAAGGAVKTNPLE
jgi:hypothetical protein